MGSAGGWWTLAGLLAAAGYSLTRLRRGKALGGLEGLLGDLGVDPGDPESAPEPARREAARRLRRLISHRQSREVDQAVRQAVEEQLGRNVLPLLARIEASLAQRPASPAVGRAEDVNRALLGGRLQLGPHGMPVVSDEADPEEFARTLARFNQPVTTPASARGAAATSRQRLQQAAEAPTDDNLSLSSTRADWPIFSIKRQITSSNIAICSSS